ncbi:DMT family transporter [Ruegeria sp. HKCCA6837]|uniref:EamA family transporter n=1 Tax=Ruegeria sp. HKCCA6837 TaxID=2682989 RepID=UPI0020C523D3|nr:hypothetical protein [Ruegeria sp. HKCCA6837]
MGFDRLPIALVAAIEFVSTIVIALLGVRTGRNYLAFAFAIIGVALLIDAPSLLAADGPDLISDLLGLFWAVLNGSLFVLYIIFGHKISEGGASGGVERLAAVLTAAFIFVVLIGLPQALDDFGAPSLVLAGIGVGICSSLISYVCDQLAMARLPRASFAFLLAHLPATATIIVATGLRQVPSAVDVLGVLLVMIGVAVHKSCRCGLQVSTATRIGHSLQLDERAGWAQCGAVRRIRSSLSLPRKPRTYPEQS